MASKESLASTNTDILLRDLNGTAGWLYGIEGRSENGRFLYFNAGKFVTEVVFVNYLL